MANKEKVYSAAAQESFGPDPRSSRVFRLSTKGFHRAQLHADGTLELEMAVSSRSCWDEKFLDGLKSDFGDKMDGTLDRLMDELNKEIACRILLD